MIKKNYIFGKRLDRPPKSVSWVLLIGRYKVVIIMRPQFVRSFHEPGPEFVCLSGKPGLRFVFDLGINRSSLTTVLILFSVFHTGCNTSFVVPTGPSVFPPYNFARSFVKCLQDFKRFSFFTVISPSFLSTSTVAVCLSDAISGRTLSHGATNRVTRGLRLVERAVVMKSTIRQCSFRVATTETV